MLRWAIALPAFRPESGRAKVRSFELKHHDLTANTVDLIPIHRRRPAHPSRPRLLHSSGPPDTLPGFMRRRLCAF